MQRRILPHADAQLAAAEKVLGLLRCVREDGVNLGGGELEVDVWLAAIRRAAGEPKATSAEAGLCLSRGIWGGLLSASPEGPDFAHLTPLKHIAVLTPFRAFAPKAG